MNFAIIQFDILLKTEICDGEADSMPRILPSDQNRDYLSFYLHLFLLYFLYLFYFKKKFNLKAHVSLMKIIGLNGLKISYT
jgi:hypothetical protein